MPFPSAWIFFASARICGEVRRRLVRIETRLLEERLVVPEHRKVTQVRHAVVLAVVAGQREVPGLRLFLYGSALTCFVMSVSALSLLNCGTSMSFRPTTSGTACARIAVASLEVSWFGEVCDRTTFSPGWLALNSFTSATPRPLVAARVQNWTVPVALTPNCALRAIRTTRRNRRKRQRRPRRQPGVRSERAVSIPFASSLRHLSVLVVIHLASQPPGATHATVCCVFEALREALRT